MGDYLIISPLDAAEPVQGRLLALQDAAQRNGMTVTALGAGWLATAGPRSMGQHPVGAWRLVGDVFPRLDPETGRRPGGSYEKGLVRRFWGRYIGVRLDGDGLVRAVLRDPSGALDCIIWRDRGLLIVCSDPPPWLVGSLQPAWRIDFGRVATALLSPVSVWGDLCLVGPWSVPAGCLAEAPFDADPTPVWTPEEHINQPALAELTTDAACARLSGVIDNTVRSFARLDARIGAEVSGGLDSSIVASALMASGSKPSLWLNVYSDGPGEDERHYAAGLGCRLDIAPTYARHRTGALTPSILTQMSPGARPGLNALDWHHDEDWAERWDGAGVNLVMTGKGGDAMLLQAANAAVLGDLWRAEGWRAVLSSSLPAIARANRQSVWSVIRQARGWARARQAAGGNVLAAPELKTTQPLHSWLRDLSHLGPAKAHQIAGLVNGLSFHAWSPQHRVADVVHPLLCQPVVETCLGLTAHQLALGGRDRGLARRAFRDRLPPEIVARRSKGDMTAFYGRYLAANLDLLRPWLLEGRLAAEGLIDRSAAEAVLTTENLIWHGRYADIIIAAALEGWVRVWEDRLSAPPPPGLSPRPRSA